MSKKLILLIIVVLVLIGGGLVLATRHTGENTTGTTGNNMSNMHMPAQHPSPTVNQPANSTITIQDFAFSPANVSVKTGTTLVWKNSDSTTHTVTSTNAPQSFDSGDLAPGKSFSFTFNTPGTYHYHCSIHPSMTGTVTVSSTQ